MPQNMTELLLGGNYSDFFSSQVEARLYNWEVTVTFLVAPRIKTQTKGKFEIQCSKSQYPP